MNLDDILERLIPLFEKKLQLMEEMQRRSMTLEEQKELHKSDLEYRKLAAQITNDQDKLAFEKEKLITAIKGQHDLEQLRNKGLLDVERLRGMNDREKQRIVELGANERAAILAQTEDKRTAATKYTAEMQALGHILGNAKTYSETDEAGKIKTIKPTDEANQVIRGLIKETGITPLPAEQPERDVIGEARQALRVASQMEVRGDREGAKRYLMNLEPATREAAKVVSESTPLQAAPAIPASPAVSPLAAVASPPVRTVPASADNTMKLTPATLQYQAEPTAGALGANGSKAPVSLMNQTPALNLTGRSDMTPASMPLTLSEEEKKRRALRNARGLSSAYASF